MTEPTIIQSLLQAPAYLSEDHVRENVFPSILATIVAISCLYSASFPLANRLIPDSKLGNDKTNKNNKSLQDRRRFAYQVTNGVTNIGLGLMGVYFQYFVLPQDATTQERIEGLHDLYIIGSIQIGFQIWSIAVGLLWVEESTEMLVHHFAVILASSQAAFLTNGFRYYAPLALGMTELSSVPLSVMNSFKNNQAWREAYPQFYLASRLIFSFCFLIIRIGIFVPQHLEYLQYAFLINYHAETHHVGTIYRLLMGVTWMGAVFLLVLQLYWGYLIVNGLSKFVLSHIRVKTTPMEKKQQ